MASPSLCTWLAFIQHLLYAMPCYGNLHVTPRKSFEIILLFPLYRCRNWNTWGLSEGHKTTHWWRWNPGAWSLNRVSSSKLDPSDLPSPCLLTLHIFSVLSSSPANLSSKHTSSSLHSIVSTLVMTSFISCPPIIVCSLSSHFFMIIAKVLFLPAVSLIVTLSCICQPNPSQSVIQCWAKPLLSSSLLSKPPPVWRNRMILPFKESR